MWLRDVDDEDDTLSEREPEIERLDDRDTLALVVTLRVRLADADFVGAEVIVTDDENVLERVGAGVMVADKDLVADVDFERENESDELAVRLTDAVREKVAEPVCGGVIVIDSDVEADREKELVRVAIGVIVELVLNEDVLENVAEAVRAKVTVGEYVADAVRLKVDERVRGGDIVGDSDDECDIECVGWDRVKERLAENVVDVVGEKEAEPVAAGVTVTLAL